MGGCSRWVVLHGIASNNFATERNGVQSGSASSAAPPRDFKKLSLGTNASPRPLSLRARLQYRREEGLRVEQTRQPRHLRTCAVPRPVAQLRDAPLTMFWYGETPISLYRVDCAYHEDWKLTAAGEREMSYARWRDAGEPQVTVERLTDERGALLFPEDRVRDGLAPPELRPVLDVVDEERRVV